ncbi:MAG: polysaccharide biosynthesis protein [bacterium]|nr:polysaccharide biosynthesis protein [bacterium]
MSPTTPRNNYPTLENSTPVWNIAIYGAGSAGKLLSKEITCNGKQRRLVGIFDDSAVPGTDVNGIKVLGGEDSLAYWINELKIDEIYLAIPSLAASVQAALAKRIQAHGIRVQTLPVIQDLLGGLPLKKQLNDDLLSAVIGREIRDIDLPRISSFITGKTILVTGAGGSIGSELAKQLSRFEPAHLLLLDQYDTHLHEIQIWLDDHNFKNYTPVLANIREKDSLADLFMSWKIDLIIHAAAIKHVPMAEDNIRETLKTNVSGTINVLELACRYDVPYFLQISTDKAVRPTNIMGASKRVGELICQNVAAFPFYNGKTVVSAVRFGNVLGSNGSVLPRFIGQIESGGPVTVTHPDIERFFMHTSEAAQLVLQAASLAEGGEIFILDMGESVRVADFAQRLCESYNLEVGKDIEILYSGLRPGEKIKEELIIQDAEEETCYDSIYIITSNILNSRDAYHLVNMIGLPHKWSSEDEACRWLCQLVPEYTSAKRQQFDIQEALRFELASVSA